MVKYPYSCSNRKCNQGQFETEAPMGPQPEKVKCPSCRRPAQRDYSGSVIGVPRDIVLYYDPDRGGNILAPNSGRTPDAIGEPKPF